MKQREEKQSDSDVRSYKVDRSRVKQNVYVDDPWQNEVELRVK